LLTIIAAFIITASSTVFRNKVEQAEAALQNALSNLDVIRSNVSSADANEHIYASNIEAANAVIKSGEVRIWKANQDYERYKNLLADNATTQHQYDAAKAEKDPYRFYVIRCVYNSIWQSNDTHFKCA
jgi:membrane fusion protein (multidrug efflux system)